MTKYLLNEDNDGLSDARVSVKNLLFTVYENPQIIATIVKSNNETYRLKILEETLCNFFYDDLLIDAKYNRELIRLLAELLKAFKKKKVSLTNELK